jgi:glycosyltransferase involved in cell wall biosynthesis
VTILHDLSLDEFFFNWRPSDLISPARSVPHGQPGTDLNFALGNSLGVVVHTADAYDRLNALNRWIVAHIPLAFSLPPFAPERSSRASAPPYRLIVFGFIHQNRRLLPFLQALSTFPERDKFQLEIYGELWEPLLVERAIADYGLKKNVKMRGFVSEQALDRALASADIAINLRYPSAEASGSQLRIWSHGLPSIVTRAGWFAELPEAAVAQVSPENEVADIQMHLSRFLAHPEHFRQMGIEGRRLLYPMHAPETYVEALFNLARQVIDFRPRKAAHYLALRTGAAMHPWIDSITSDEALRRVAEEMLTLTGASAAVSAPAVTGDEK